MRGASLVALDVLCLSSPAFHLLTPLRNHVANPVYCRDLANRFGLVYIYIYVFSRVCMPLLFCASCVHVCVCVRFLFVLGRPCQVTAVNAVEDEELKAVNNKEVNELEDRLKAAGVPFEP